MYFGGTYDFVCERPLLDMQDVWNAAGPYRWDAFDNDQYGAYIVARESSQNLRIRVLGEAPNYSLDVDGDVTAADLESARTLVLSMMLERLLPLVGASAIRDTTRETRRP